MKTPAKESVSSGILLVVSLYVRPGREQELRDFETQAARVMARHGGRIETVIRPTASPSAEPLPYEIHLVSFPSMERFDSYRSDPALAGLAALREQAMARTTVVIGREVEPYE